MWWKKKEKESKAEEVPCICNELTDANECKLVAQLKDSKQRKQEALDEWEAMSKTVISDDTFSLFESCTIDQYFSSGDDYLKAKLVRRLFRALQELQGEKILEDISKIVQIITRIKKEEQLQKELKAQLGIE